MSSRSITLSEYSQLAAMRFGQRIRFVRKLVSELNGSGNLSTTELARKIGVKPQSLTAIERDEVPNPTFRVILGLAKAFGVSPDVFTNEYYDRNSPNLFTIGIYPVDEPTYEMQAIEPEIQPGTEPRFRLSFEVNQVFNNQEEKTVLSRTTKNDVSVMQFVQIMARILTEIDIIESDNTDDGHPKYSKAEENAYNRALRLYHGSLEYPGAFPHSVKSQEVQNDQ